MKTSAKTKTPDVGHPASKGSQQSAALTDFSKTRDESAGKVSAADACREELAKLRTWDQRRLPDAIDAVTVVLPIAQLRDYREFIEAVFPKDVHSRLIAFVAEVKHKLSAVKFKRRLLVIATERGHHPDDEDISPWDIDPDELKEGVTIYWDDCAPWERTIHNALDFAVMDGLDLLRGSEILYVVFGDDDVKRLVRAVVEERP